MNRSDTYLHLKHEAECASTHPNNKASESKVLMLSLQFELMKGRQLHALSHSNSEQNESSVVYLCV